MTQRRNRRQNKGHKKFRLVIEVFCDGETEKQYVESVRSKLRNESVTFHIHPLFGRADRFEDVFEEIQSLLDTEEYKHNMLIFYITDMDTIHAQKKFKDYNQMKQKCLASPDARKRLFIIETRPCFEFWLLLHYVHTTKPFACCDEVEAELKDHWPEYKKSSKCAKQIFDKLQDRLETAIERARKIEPTHSYSQMYILFDELKKRLPDCDLTQP